MSEATLPTLPGMIPEPSWLAEGVRVTAFAMPGIPLVPKKWTEVFGREPDEIIKQPGAPTLEGGLINGVRWLIGHQPTRVDVMVMPPNPTEPPTDLLNVGGFLEVIDPLLDASRRVFGETAVVQRVAIGGGLFQSVDTIRDAVDHLYSSVPQLRNLPREATDIMFQLNLPETLDDPIPQLRVNRLLKWQVAAVQLFGVTAGLPGMSLQLAPMAARPILRFEMDINTPPDRMVAIPSDKLGLLIMQLGQIAKKLAKTGGFPS